MIIGVIKRLALSYFISFLCITNSFALPSFDKVARDNVENSAPAVLKADEINGDKVKNFIIAKGNAEVAKGSNIIYADELIYQKNDGIIRAIGNVKIKNFEVGNVTALQAELKDDFSSGNFIDSKLIFNDGSYLTSPKITRKTPLITILDYPIYSVCPNPEISKNNELAGKKRNFLSIKSKTTTIDRKENIMVSKGGVIRFYDVPLLYTPYISTPLSSKEKKSGFLIPGYAKSTNLGLGVKIPYYFYIAPNMDLTTTPLIGVDNSQILITNSFRHKNAFGQYYLDLEVANNKTKSIANSTLIPETKKEYRYNINGLGDFDFTKNTGLDFNINSVGDRNYLRDYHFNYSNHILSKVNLDYIKSRNYHSIEAIDIQELASVDDQRAEPFIVPVNSYIETKPLSFKEKYSLASNLTIITREDGLQYRHASLDPRITLPLNIKGNLFKISARVQGDLYYLENNFKHLNRNSDYDSVESNYKPEASLSWSLPLIKKSKTNRILIEPMANIVISSDHRGATGIPNEDSNDAELTVNNLFIADRISGLDRNETGKRLNYGIKSSLFNENGEFALTLGQGYRSSNDQDRQDVEIRGFNNSNKSSIVGQAMYKAKKIFSIIYSFQLSESNYRNDLNQISTIIDFERFKLSANYLLIRRTLQNENERRQLVLNSEVKLNKRWNLSAASTMDLVNSREISRSIAVSRDGCCTTFGFSVSEANPTDLIKPQRSFNLRLSFKNL